MNWRVWVDKNIQLFYEVPMKYYTDKGAHSVYCIQFHLVICVKYRRKVITDEISDYLKKTVIEISKKYGINVIEQETDLDHIHLLFSSKPSITLSVFVNSLKSVTSRLIRKNFPEVKKFLWGGKFWSPSYFLSSVGQVSLDDVKKYIENQGK